MRFKTQNLSALEWLEPKLENANLIHMKDNNHTCTAPHMLITHLHMAAYFADFKDSMWCLSEKVIILLSYLY